MPTEPALDSEQVYPYLVPEAYLEHQSSSDSPTQPLGHGISVALVADFNGVVRNITVQDLEPLALPWEDARSRALRNLEKLLANGTISMKLFEKGPADLPFIVIGGHWAAATAILLPKLRSIAATHFAGDSVCASIPHRAALLLFPCGTVESRAAMRAMILKHEGAAKKPLTFELFSLTEAGVKPLPVD
ncbi:MAG: hypothetical protein HOW73_41205 [Polyangiaceae bacterium]|nr:hypothetical protein [Polyangiaceae bacterium]